MYQFAKSLLYVDRGKGDCLPKVTAVLASQPEVLIEFLFNHGIVLNGQCVPHQLVTSLLIKVGETN